MPWRAQRDRSSINTSIPVPRNGNYVLRWTTEAFAGTLHVVVGATGGTVYWKSTSSYGAVLSLMPKGEEASCVPVPYTPEYVFAA